MARKQRLKVYRTPIGFHDAYVAAPSQKAALAAWGSEVDLFARGVAEIVDDAALTREPLAEPGKVIRRSRGSAEDHLAALPPEQPRQKSSSADPVEGTTEGVTARRRPPRKGKGDGRPRTASAAGSRGRRERRTPEVATESKPKPTSKAKTKPRPSRKRLDDAERALEDLRTHQRAEAAKLRDEEQAAARRRRDADRRHEREVAEAERRVDSARRAYSEALARS